MDRWFRILFPLVVAVFCVLGMALMAAPPQQQAEYAGNKKCKKCHIKQYKTWSATKHSKAFECLDAEHQKDPECVKCHTTGFGKGGFVSLKATPNLLNVQCEQCHGPGSDHIALMTKLRKSKVDKADYPKEKKIIRKVTGCTECHNPHVKHAPVEKK